MRYVNRHENMEKVLATVVDNGLRSGWLSLGHGDGVGQMIPLLNSSGAAGSSITTREGTSGEGRWESGSAP